MTLKFIVAALVLAQQFFSAQDSGKKFILAIKFRLMETLLRPLRSMPAITRISYLNNQELSWVTLL